LAEEERKRRIEEGCYADVISKKLVHPSAKLIQQKFFKRATQQQKEHVSQLQQQPGSHREWRPKVQQGDVIREEKIRDEDQERLEGINEAHVLEEQERERRMNDPEFWEAVKSHHNPVAELVRESLHVPGKPTASSETSSSATERLNLEEELQERRKSAEWSRNLEEEERQRRLNDFNLIHAIHRKDQHPLAELFKFGMSSEASGDESDQRHRNAQVTRQLEEEERQRRLREEWRDVKQLRMHPLAKIFKERGFCVSKAEEDERRKSGELSRKMEEEERLRRVNELKEESSEQEERWKSAEVSRRLEEEERQRRLNEQWQPIKEKQEHPLAKLFKESLGFTSSTEGKTEGKVEGKTAGQSSADTGKASVDEEKEEREKNAEVSRKMEEEERKRRVQEETSWLEEHRKEVGTLREQARRAEEEERQSRIAEGTRAPDKALEEVKKKAESEIIDRVAHSPSHITTK
jgi:hypothetical protein